VHEHIAIERQAHVTGTVGRSYSRQSLCGLDADGQPVEAKQAAAVRVQSEIAAIAGRLPGPVLLVSNKAVIETMLEKGAIGDAARAAWLGNLRGLNEYSHCGSAIVAGREAVSIEAVEDTARAFCADDPTPFLTYAGLPPADWAWQHWPYRASRGRRMRDGSVQVVEVEVHPDPRVQDVLEQIREHEVVQGIDRVRPIFNRRTIVAMNSLVLDITYDRVLTHAELVDDGTSLERAYRRTGILPLNAAALHAAHPDLYVSAKAAEHVLARVGVFLVVARGGVSLAAALTNPQKTAGFSSPTKYPQISIERKTTRLCD